MFLVEVMRWSHFQVVLVRKVLRCFIPANDELFSPMMNYSHPNDGFHSLQLHRIIDGELLLLLLLLCDC